MSSQRSPGRASSGGVPARGRRRAPIGAEQRGDRGIEVAAVRDLAEPVDLLAIGANVGRPVSHDVSAGAGSTNRNQAMSTPINSNATNTNASTWMGTKPALRRKSGRERDQRQDDEVGARSAR